MDNNVGCDLLYAKHCHKRTTFVGQFRHCSSNDKLRINTMKNLGYVFIFMKELHKFKKTSSGQSRIVITDDIHREYIICCN